MSIVDVLETVAAMARGQTKEAQAKIVYNFFYERGADVKTTSTTLDDEALSAVADNADDLAAGISDGLAGRPNRYAAPEA